MDSEDEYVRRFMQYINNFVTNIRPDDPLPVRAPSYKVTETEIDGQIIDIVYHYLNHRECPPYLRSLVAHQVWAAIRNRQHNGQEGDDDGCDMLDYGNTTFEPMKLIQDVTRRANTLMMDYQNTLSPLEVKAMPRYLPVSQYAIKNTRRKMEDRHTIIQDLNTLYDLNCGHPHAYYGVFDGHAGTDAAVYSAAHLHQYLIQNPMYEIDPVAALKHAFCFIDTNFSKKFSKERLKGGTTAVVALIREKRLVVAWLGDSLALLVRKRNPVQIVQPHKPEMTSERKRIEDAGGCVVNIQGTWRVLGQLAVSRAIGDVEYKPFVSAECDIKSLEICGDEDFLILACDGLWDTLKPESAVNIVYSYLAKNDGDTDGVGRCLVEAARLAGSEDNITAVVVFLRPVNVLMEEEAIRVAQGEVPELDSTLVPQKDSLPASINAIFCPPPIFNPDPNPFSQTVELEPLKNGDLEHGLPQPMETSNLSPSGDVPADVIIHDSDSDEGVGPDIGMMKEERMSPVRSAVTEEEVDAALAELDSLPDGACETGDIEEEEEDEGWAYYKMEPQNEIQNEDVITAGPVHIESPDTLPISDHEMQESIPTEPIEIQNPDIISSPHKSPSGSPRTVEGFITSVELNTPEESFNTNLAINQSTEYFNGGQIDQNSGPFSVYVSSSPEPASMEAPPTQAQSDLHDFSGFGNDLIPDFRSELSDTAESPSVEIVHAQSTVEVVATPSPVEVPSPCHEQQSMLIPDFMTQSVTGDLPYEPYIPSPDTAYQNVDPPQNFEALLSEAKQFEMFAESQNETASVLESESVLINSEESTTLITHEHHTISEESSNLIEQLESTVNDVASVVKEITSNSHIEESINLPETEVPFEDLEKDFVDETPAADTTQEFYYQKDTFTTEVSKAFDAPLDEMMMSYHEDQNPLMEVASAQESVNDEAKLSPVNEDAAFVEAQIIETLASEVSNLDIASEVPEVHEISDIDMTCDAPEVPMVTPSTPETPQKPITAPRSTPKTAPPKPSPRTVGSKLTPTSGPSPSTRTATKKPAPLSAQKALSKSSAPKPAATPSAARSRPTASATTTTTTNTRAASATTRTPASKLTATAPSRSKSTTATSTRMTTTTLTTAKTKPTTSTTTRTSVLAPKTRPASTTLNKVSSAPTKPLTSTTTVKTSTSKMSNGIVSNSKTTTTSRTSTLGAGKPATSTLERKLPTSALTSKPTSLGSRKPMIPGSKSTTSTTTTSTLKKAPVSVTSTKDSKNNTNRLLSTTKSGANLTTTRTTTVTKSPLSTKTTLMTKTRTVPLKTTKITSPKPKKPENSPSQKDGEPSMADSENKIVDEETSVEIKDKVNEEELITKEAVVAAELQQEILVNGGDY